MTDENNIPKVPQELRKYHKEENKENCLFFADKERNVHLSYGEKVTEFSFSIPKENYHEQGFIKNTSNKMIKITELFMTKEINRIQEIEGAKKSKYNELIIDK